MTTITDTRAFIPPAAQTTPPTYGQVSVPAHALQAGAIGNIQAGDINEPCCVTSVIAQNPYNFTGGTDARDFTYLTAQDVSYAIADNVQQLEEQTKALFPTKTVLEPTCTTTHRVNPAIGNQTRTARITLTAVCTAVSYSLALTRNRIMEAGKRYGDLSNIQIAIVGITQKKGIVVLHLYVTAQVRPIIHVPIR